MSLLPRIQHPPRTILWFRSRMMIGLLFSLIGLSVILTTPTLVCAEPLKLPLIAFSADVKRQNADRKTTLLGKMIVSPEGVRSESERDGVRIVRIHKLAQKTIWTLFMAEKTYTELIDVALSRPPLPDEPESPCRTNQELICTLLGPATLNGRSVMHWEITTKGPQGNTPYAHLWIDQRLKIAIREQYADGLIEELGNIKEGDQPAHLFDIPKDFKKIVTPAAPPVATQ